MRGGKGMGALLAAALAFSTPALSSPPPPIEPRALKAVMTKFVAAGKPHRTPGSKGNEAAFKYLRLQFSKLAKAAKGGRSRVREHLFQPDVELAARGYQRDFDTQVEGKFPPESEEYRKWKRFTESAIAFVRSFKGKEGRNLVLDITGTKKPQEVVWVGAHYDTITHDKAGMTFTPDVPAPGADDNASGVVALLAAARYLTVNPPERTVRFVAFDYEEIFFLGAHALAKDIVGGMFGREEAHLGLFNLEMIGFSSKKPSVLKLYIREEADADGHARDRKLADLVVKGVNATGVKLAPSIVANGFNRSDNWAFWQSGIPSVCITQDWEGDFHEADYHTANDSIARVNFDYLAAVTRAVIEAVRLAGSPGA